MTWHGGLSNNVQEAMDLNPQSINGTSSMQTINGTGVDMAGWDGVAFYFAAGVVTGAGAYGAYLQWAADGDSAFATPTNVLDASGNLVCLPANVNTANSIGVLEVWRPNGRYVRSVSNVNLNLVQLGVTSMRYRRNGLLPARATAANRVIARVN